jgi:hypothetical protein
MKNKKLFSVISTLILAGLLIFTACPNEPDNGGGGVQLVL